MSREEIKSRAKQQLGGKLFGKSWLMAILATLVFSFVSGISAAIFIAWFVIGGAMFYGLKYIYLKQARDGQPMNVGDVFKGFSEDFGQLFMINFMSGLFIALWSMLLIVPGIIKYFQYSMAYYVKIDHPEYKWNECINESKELMRGNCGRLFVLNLSFIGWYFVCTFTAGLGYWWLIPYMAASEAQFYEAIKAEKNRNAFGNNTFNYGYQNANNDVSQTFGYNDGANNFNGSANSFNGGANSFNGGANSFNGNAINQNNYMNSSTPVFDPAGPTQASRGNGMGIGVVRCLSGDWAGAEFNLQNMETINIGRDPSRCNIVLNDMTVSSLHCSIQFDAYKGRYIITDHSTNSTFIADGNGNEFIKMQREIPAEVLSCKLKIGNSVFCINQ